MPTNWGLEHPYPGDRRISRHCDSMARSISGHQLSKWLNALHRSSGTRDALYGCTMTMTHFTRWLHLVAMTSHALNGHDHGTNRAQVVHYIAYTNNAGYKG